MSECRYPKLITLGGEVLSVYEMQELAFLVREGRKYWRGLEQLGENGEWQKLEDMINEIEEHNKKYVREMQATR